MADTPVYMLVNLKVTDADEYRKYEKGFFGILKRYGGQFITYDDNPIALEGDSPRDGRMILFSFPSKKSLCSENASSSFFSTLFSALLHSFTHSFPQIGSSMRESLEYSS